MTASRKRSTLTFFEHLDELRARVLIAVGSIMAVTAAAFLRSDLILQLLLAPLLPISGQVYFFSPTEAFIVKAKVAFLTAVILTSPVWMGQLWFFVSPGLHPREKKAVVPVIVLTSSLFIAGAAFCYVFVLPAAFNVLVGMQTDYFRPLISADRTVDFLSGMFLAFGFAFNVPVVLMALAFMRVLASSTILRYWRHAVVLIFIAAAVLTPGPDIASQLLLALPLVLLFGLGVVGAKLIEISRKK